MVLFITNSADHNAFLHIWHMIFLHVTIVLLSWCVKNSYVIGWANFNTLRPRQNGRRFADDTFKRIFLNENVRISITISLKFVPNGPINNIPSLVQIMAWSRSGDKPLSEPMMVSLPTHICVTRPQWVKQEYCKCWYWHIYVLNHVIFLGNILQPFLCLASSGIYFAVI